MAIYKKRSFGAGEARPGELELAQASQLLGLEGISSPRRAGCLRLKLSHGPGEPDAGMGEFRSRKFRKMTILPLSLWLLFPDLTIKHQP